MKKRKVSQIISGAIAGFLTIRREYQWCDFIATATMHCPLCRVLVPLNVEHHCSKNGPQS